jgi:hypothetical protein
MAFCQYFSVTVKICLVSFRYACNVNMWLTESLRCLFNLLSVVLLINKIQEQNTSLPAIRMPILMEHRHSPIQ